jgi:tight adherence protein C
MFASISRLQLVDSPYYGYQAMSEWLLRLSFVGLLLFYMFLVSYAWRQGKRRQLRLHIDPFTMIFYYRPILERTLPLLQRQRLSLALLNGGECPRELLIGWAAESIGLSYLIACLSSLLGMMAGNPTLLVMGVIVACCLPVLRTKELTKKVNQRRFTIVMELPELLSRLLLMVNAGETVLRAISRCAEQKAGSEHPLYVELNRAIEGMKRGESLSLVLEEMGRRCAVPEVRLFATTVLINARRGGESFVPALRELTRQMWEKRKSLARMLGEQASSRLAFPLAVIFLLIMVLVGAPTILMM